MSFESLVQKAISCAAASQLKISDPNWSKLLFSCDMKNTQYRDHVTQSIDPDFRPHSTTFFVLQSQIDT